MGYLLQLALILILLLVGTAIQTFIIPYIPGSVIGMILLFILLESKIIKLKQIEKISDFVLKNLALFFVPPGVQLLKYYKVIEGEILSVTIIIVVSTFVVMATSGIVTSFLVKAHHE